MIFIVNRLEYVGIFKGKIEKELNTFIYYKTNVMASLMNPNTVYDRCNYYIMIRVNKSHWECFLDKPFILNTNDGKLCGQFLSSLWMKLQIQSEDSLDLLIIKLPRRDSTIHPNHQITFDILINSLTHFEQNNTDSSNINYETLDFVVIHKHYGSNLIKYICNKLVDKLKDNDKRDAIRDNELFGSPIFSSIDITFEVVREDAEPDTLEDLNNSIPIPRLIRNDGSWNTYRNSFSETDVNYYITCPIFTLNIR